MKNEDRRNMTLELISRLKEEKRMEIQLSHKRLKESFAELLLGSDKEKNVAGNSLINDFGFIFSLIQSMGVAIKFIRKCKKMFVDR